MVCPSASKGMRRHLSPIEQETSYNAYVRHIAPVIIPERLLIGLRIFENYNWEVVVTK